MITDRQWWWPRHVITPATSAAESQLRQLDSAHGPGESNDGDGMGATPPATPAAAEGVSDTITSAAAGRTRGSATEEAVLQLSAPGWQRIVASQAAVAAFVDRPDNGLVAVYQHATSAAVADGMADHPDDDASEREDPEKEDAHIVRRAVAAARSLRRHEQNAADTAAAEEEAAIAEEAAREAAAALECQRMQPDLDDRSSAEQAAEERRAASFAAAGTLGRVAMKPLQPEWWRVFPQTARALEPPDQ